MSDNGVEVLESARAFIRREAAAVHHLAECLDQSFFDVGQQAHPVDESGDIVHFLRAPGVVFTVSPIPVTDRSNAVDDVIAPGSTASASFDGRAVVARFERMLPVGVDGGVTSVVAGSTRSLGAEHIVCGRAVFFSPDESRPFQRED